MIFSRKINTKFLLFKKLSVLGLFHTKKLALTGENGFYNLYLSYFEKNIYSISIFSLFKSISKVYPLINLLMLKKSTLLFINIDKQSNSFLTKIFYSLLKKIKAYCIYDWGFGLLTNFSKTYYEFFLENKVHLHKMPNIIFFLRILEKQHYILTEVQNTGALSLGLIDYENSGSIDYPIPSNSSLEYSYFFFRMLSRIITDISIYKVFNLDQINAELSKKKKIKRLKFCDKILLKNRRKKVYL